MISTYLCFDPISGPFENLIARSWFQPYKL